MRFKKLYDTMLDSGDLLDLFPTLSGVWEKDEQQFIEEQTAIEDLLMGLEIDTDLDAEDEY